MLFLAAAAIAASVPQAPARTPVAATVQARVTIRILSGATVRFGQARDDNEGTRRTTMIQAEGSARPANLIEFQ
jgi:hypothetical protein